MRPNRLAVKVRSLTEAIATDTPSVQLPNDELLTGFEFLQIAEQDRARGRGS